MIIYGRFKIDLYDVTIHIRLADSDKNFLQSINYFLAKDGEDILKDSPGGYFYRAEGDAFNYYVFFNKSTLTFEIFNHEKSHVIDYILEDREIKATDEIRSYLDGFVSHKMHLFFKKRKIKLKHTR